MSGKAMPPTRKTYWAWLILGTAVFAHSLITSDGGIPGLLLYWQLKLLSVVFVATTPLLALFLIGIPAVQLWRSRARGDRAPLDRRKMAAVYARRSAIAAILLAAAAGLAYWRTLLLPSAVGPARQLSLDELPATAMLDEQHCTLAGVLQQKYGTRYEQVLTGRSTHVSVRHSIIPITRPDWTSSQPVRFLVDAPHPAGATASGLLLRGQLPSYVRRALERKGLHIASDVMVFSTDPDFGRTAWYAAAGLLVIGVFVTLVFACGWTIVSKRTDEQMEVTSVRAPAFLLLLPGLLSILVGIGFAAHKIAYIARAAKADGVIEDVQDSDSGLGRYSFYVNYTTPQGRFHQYASTDTPFSKARGDKVTVLYNPEDPQSAEVLAFDTIWVLCTLLLAVGAAFIVPGAILLARSNARRSQLPETAALRGGGRVA